MPLTNWPVSVFKYMSSFSLLVSSGKEKKKTDSMQSWTPHDLIGIDIL